MSLTAETKILPPRCGETRWIQFSMQPGEQDGEDLFSKLGAFLAGPENPSLETVLCWIIGGVPFFADSPESLELSKKVSRSHQRRGAKTVEFQSPFFRRSYPIAPEDPNAFFPPVIDYMPFANVPNLSPVLFIGPAGCGKTLLARGIFQEYRRFHPNDKRVMITGNDFVRSLQQAATDGTLHYFYQFFDEAKLVIIDSIEPIFETNSGPETLISLIDRFALRRALLLLTLSALPSKRQGIMENLHARLLGGLPVPIRYPGKVTRQILVQQFGKLHGISLTPKIVKILTNSLPAPPGAMYGAFRQMAETFRWPQQAPSETKIQLFLDERNPPPKLELDTIARTTAKHFAVKLSEMRSKSRHKSVVMARNMTVVLARKLLSVTYVDLGNWFAGRDHTTILHGEKEINRLIAEDPAIAATETAILQELTGREND